MDERHTQRGQPHQSRDQQNIEDSREQETHKKRKIGGTVKEEGVHVVRSGAGRVVNGRGLV